MYMSALEMENWAMVKAAIHYHWQSVTVWTWSFVTIRGLQAGLSPCLQPLTLERPAWPLNSTGSLENYKRIVATVSVFPSDWTTNPYFQPQHSTKFKVPLQMIADVCWYGGSFVNGVVVDATLTTASFKPPVMNSSHYVQEGMSLIFGADWRGCLFFLSLFSFSCVSSLFLPVFY